MRKFSSWAAGLERLGPEFPEPIAAVSHERLALGLKVSQVPGPRHQDSTQFPAVAARGHHIPPFDARTPRKFTFRLGLRRCLQLAQDGVQVPDRVDLLEIDDCGRLCRGLGNHRRLKMDLARQGLHRPQIQQGCGNFGMRITHLKSRVIGTEAAPAALARRPPALSSG